MIRIPIRSWEIDRAKILTEQFDKQKLSDKFKCDTNYIGVLGEIVLDRFLKERNANYTWIDFVKKGYDDPDFLIDGLKIDLKTTYSTKMWIQKAVHDKYIFSRVNDDLKELILISIIDGKKMQKLIDTNKLEIIRRGGRNDFLVAISQMCPVEMFFK